MSWLRIIQKGPLMPTKVPNQTKTRSSHSGHSKLPWISRRWNPTEWPSSRVAPVVTTKAATAARLKVMAPKIRVAASMPPFHSE